MCYVIIIIIIIITIIIIIKKITEKNSSICFPKAGLTDINISVSTSFEWLGPFEKWKFLFLDDSISKCSSFFIHLLYEKKRLHLFVKLFQNLSPFLHLDNIFSFIFQLLFKNYGNHHILLIEIYNLQ